jgi:hypothetical protein
VSGEDVKPAQSCAPFCLSFDGNLPGNAATRLVEQFLLCAEQESVDYVAAHPDALMTSDEEDDNVDSNGAPQRPHSFLTKPNP